MARRIRTKFNESPSIVRLWTLRVLTDLRAHRNFITTRDFNDDDLARGLGLGNWVDKNSDEFDRRSVLAELYDQHAQLTRLDENKAIPRALVRNLQELAELAGLTDTDRKLLAFAVLLANDSLLKSATDLLGDLNSRDVSRVLGAILQMSESRIRDALRYTGALARSGLLKINTNRNYLQHKLGLISTEFSAYAMIPDTRPIDLLRDVVIPAPPAELSLDDYPHLSDSLDILIPYLRHALETGRKGVNVFLHGPPGTGKTQLARALATHLKSELFEVSSEDDDGDPCGGNARLNALRAGQCILGQGRSLVLFDEVEDVFGGGPAIFRNSAVQGNKAWMNRMLEGNDAPTLWLSNNIHDLDPAFVRRFDMAIEVPIPPRSQRERTASAVCGDLVDHATLARIANCEALAPAVVSRTASVVRAIGSNTDHPGNGKVIERLIDGILTAQGHAPLRAGDANRLPDTYDPAFLHADADLARVADGLAGSRSGRLCLYGPPGTGKTAYGHWLGRRLGMPLLVKRASDLLSMWVGEAEKNIAAAFREAERNGAVLLIDEVDSFLRERADAQHSWEVTQANEMLTQMEAFPGIFIASTNLMGGLDQAALRRFDLKVKFDFLRPEQAAEMLRRYCAKLDLPVPDAAEELARKRLRHVTPGDFAAVMRQHRFRPIASADALVAALHAECAVKQASRPAIGFIH